MRERTLPHLAENRKLFVSAKPWNGIYDPKMQDDGYSLYESIYDVLCIRPWSPIRWELGHRLENRFIASDWLVLDYDSNTLTAEQAMNVFADYRSIISLTKSHTSESHCLRVCIPWAERITAVDIYKHNLIKNADFYESDQRALNAARFFWPSKEIYAINTEGELMEIESPPRKTTDTFEYIQMEKPARREIPSYYFHLVKTGLDHAVTGRNEPLWKLCKDLLKEFWSDDEIMQLIKRINCNPRYRDDEYEKCLRWAKASLKKEAKKRA